MQENVIQDISQCGTKGDWTEKRKIDALGFVRYHFSNNPRRIQSLHSQLKVTTSMENIEEI